MNNLESILSAHKKDFASIVPQKFLQQDPFIFDFTKHNLALGSITAADIAPFKEYIDSTLRNARRIWGVGGYGEDRVLYRSNLFTAGDEARTIHLAVDIWMPLGTEIYSPLAARVHSFQDNNHLLDYGATIILEHELDGTIFYTLYGHLSRPSLEHLTEGMSITKGQKIATLGDYNENGQWPSHVHFQIISDMLGKKGDFAGVASTSQKERYLGLCPDPNLILRIPGLAK